MTSADRESLKLRVMRHEGERTTRGRHMPYTDTAGKITIGHGRNLTDRGLSDDEAAFLLENDLDDAVSECLTVFPWFPALDGVRAQVLAELMFNMGRRVLLTFTTTLKYYAAGDYVRAAANLRLSKWFRQVGPEPGQRGWRLVRMLETGLEA